MKITPLDMEGSFRRTREYDSKIPEWKKKVDWRAVGREIDKNCIIPSRSLPEIRKEVLGIEDNKKKKLVK